MGLCGCTTLAELNSLRAGLFCVRVILEETKVWS